MKIETRPLSAIKPYEKNPRLNDAAVEAVARSIQEYGFKQPLVVDTDGVSVVNIPNGCMLDGEAIQAVGATLFDLVDKDSKKKLLLDFGDIRFMSSQILGVLLTLRRKAERGGATIVLTGIREQLMRVFEITNLDTMFNFFDRREEGLAHFGCTPADNSGA